MTGQPSFVSSMMHCPVIEIPVMTGAVNSSAVLALGPEFDRLVQAGYEATVQALAPQQ